MAAPESNSVDPIVMLIQEIAALKEAILTLAMAVNVSVTRLPTPPAYPPVHYENMPYITPFPVIPPVDPLNWQWVRPPVVTCNAEGGGDGLEGIFGPRD